jgi:hypothetical protein
MSDPNHQPAPKMEDDEEEEVSSGPSLPLLYSLIALALAAAIGCALLIVLPFYRRAH